MTSTYPFQPLNYHSSMVQFFIQTITKRGLEYYLFLEYYNESKLTTIICLN